MNRNNIPSSRSFFLPKLSVYAVCAAVAGLNVLPVSVFGQDAAAKDDVKVTSYGTVDLAVQDTDLGQVLQMLSIQSKKNIITSPASPPRSQPTSTM
jgi:hypothetical protein